MEVELLNTGFIGGDGSTLNTYVASLNGLSSLDGYLVIGGITVLDRQVEVLDGNIDEGSNEFILDNFPDDTSHLVTVHLDNWINNLNLLHY